MSEEIEIENPAPEIPAYAEYAVEGVGTVIDPAGEPGYRVRLPSGQVTAYPAQSGEPCEANAAADIAYAIAHPVSFPARWSRRQFKDRFTSVEWAAILAARESDANVETFYREFSLADYIDSSDPLTGAGLDYLVSVALLTAERKAAILTP